MLRVPLDPALIVGFVLALVRASAWLVVAPPFSSPSIPAMAKVGIALGLAIGAAPSLAPLAARLSWAAIGAEAVLQAASGLALGLVVAVLFSAIEAAGNLIGLMGGFSIPSALDPLSASQTSPIGQLYSLIALTLMFTSNAYLLVARGFLSSFGAGFSLANSGGLAGLLVSELASFFTSAVEIAAPICAVLFAAQMVLGILAKAIPQMNIFTFSFSFQILAALVLLVMGLGALPGWLADIIVRALGGAHNWLVGG
jgi:flagellar biosynthetic protein FliR